MDTEPVETQDDTNRRMRPASSAEEDTDRESAGADSEKTRTSVLQFADTNLEELPGQFDASRPGGPDTNQTEVLQFGENGMPLGNGIPAVLDLPKVMTFDQRHSGDIRTLLERTIGRYRLIDVVGSGGMGIVYVARDEELHRKVAIKVLRPEMSSWDSGESLLDEAKTMARLSHPNVCTVYESGKTKDSVYIAMEYVDGQTLREWLETPRSWHEIANVMAAAGRGLQAAHDAGIIHRDLKPDNIMIDRTGRVRVMDFGIAKASPRQSMISISALDANPDVEDSSGTAGLVGTPAYMAPELLRGHPADKRSDLFALGVTFYQALTGERPYRARRLKELMKVYEAGTIVEPPSAKQIPRWLLDVALRAAALDPDVRYATVGECVAELARIPRRRRAIFIGSLVSAIALCIAVSMLILYQRSKPGENPCQGAEAHLAKVWNQAQRTRISDALGQSGLPRADEHVTRVVALIDDYARNWVDMHRDACEDTRVRGEQSELLLDRRMACLDTRREELDGLLALLGEGERDIAGRAVEAVLSLDDIEHCEARAAHLAVTPEPTDSDARERLDQLRVRLSRAKAQHDAGRYRVVLPEAEKLVGDARALGYEPMIAETLALEGRIRTQLGEFALAEERLVRAAWSAEKSGHDLAKSEAMIDLIRLVGFDLGRVGEGLQWAGFAQAALDRIGGHARLRGRFLRNKASALYRGGEFPQALELHQQALAVKRAEYSQDHVEIALTLNDLGSTSLMLGRLDESLQYHRQALAASEKLLGTEHPIAADAINNLGNAYFSHEQFEEARTYYQQALDIWRAFFGEQHPRVAIGLTNLGNLAFSNGRYDRAISFFQQALTIEERTLGPEHPDVGASAGNLGTAQLARGDIQAAVAALSRAVDILDDARTGDAAHLRFTLARALRAASRHESSREFAQSARVLFALHGERFASDIAELDEWLKAPGS